MSGPAVSIIIPVLNEAAGIVQLLQGLQAFRRQGAELIVVDGGSTDDTLRRAGSLADGLICAARGRGSQMNAGAARARGEVVLFLHADTRLPAAALERLATACAAGALWGRFDVNIEGAMRGLGVVAFMMNWRSRLTGIATGDQAIFVTRDVFRQLGGFPEIPLMEDIVLSRRLRAIAAPACLTDRVTTSGRRWEQHGLLPTILRMWWLRWRFHCGASPAELAREYGCVPDER